MSFCYTGTGPLNSLVVDLNETPALTPLQCFSDIWVECTLTPVSANGDGTFNIAASYFDPTAGVGGACQNNTPAGGTCPGFLASGAGFSAALVPDPTPEPSTILLFGTGLLALFGLGRKRFTGVQSVA